MVLYSFLVKIALIWMSFLPVIQVQEGPQIEFEFEQYDFDQVLQGDKPEIHFAFQNTGDRPLVISNVLTSCGCTASDWPTTPIAPGSSSSIRVTFDSTGKIGFQKKIITVLSNATNNRKEVSIVAQVLPKRSQF